MSECTCSSPEEAIARLAQQGGKVDEDTIAQLYDQLKPIEPSFLCKDGGEWEGGVFDTGHSGIAVVKNINWAGKTFKSENDVDSAMVYDKDGNRVWCEQYGHARCITDNRYHQAEIPGVNGITNARSVARFYASLVEDLDNRQQKRLLNEDIMKKATISNTPENDIDLVRGYPNAFAMGLQVFDNDLKPFGSEIFDHEVQKDDPNRQVYVSFPSSSLAKQMDMEMIEILLNLHDIKIEDKFNENENEYFRRVTIQLGRIDDVEKLLSSPVINHHGIDIKFKHTNQIIDRTRFLLKTSINNVQDKIISSRMELYISTLIKNNSISKISDLSTSTEQIILVHCNRDIDFDGVRQAYKSKQELSGKHLTLNQVYECDALEVHYNDTNKSITVEDLKIIFESAWNDIFAFNFPTNNCAEIEFINTQAFKRWISTVEQIQIKFQITINPILDSVDENNDTESISSTHAAPSTIDTCSIASNGFDDRSRQTTIKLRPDWVLIATHPKFKLEYKEFIHNELSGEIDIHDDEVTYSGSFPQHIHGMKNNVTLQEKTNNFMRNFAFRTFYKLESRNIEILRANAATVAFNRIIDNDYMIATKVLEMPGFVRKLFAKNNQHHQQEQPYLKTNTQSNNNIPVLSSVTSTSMYPVNTPEQVSMFSIDTFEDRLRQYLQETFNVQVTFERTNNNNNNNEKTKGLTNCILIKLMGQMNDLENATKDLYNLFLLLQTKIFNEKTNSYWTKIEEATHVIQYHFKLANLICTCQQISPTTVYVHYFDITNPQFGIDEQKIEDLIQGQFKLATINYDQPLSSSTFTKEWIDIENTIRQRDDFKKNICLYKESNTVYLFGLTELVKKFHQKFQQLKNKHDPQPCKITLSERQLKYLTYVAKADLVKLEKQYKSDGCNVSLNRLRHHCEFIAPPDMHAKIKDSLEALTQIRDSSFEIDEPGCEALISQESERLLTIVKLKCFLEKTTETRRIHISIPRARAANLDDDIKQAQSTSTIANELPNKTSVNIGHSTVTILTGDLTTQTVDAIVLCSSSEYLCKKIVDQAGVQIQNEYNLLKASEQFPNTTSGGTLPCKKIFFIPWSPKTHDPADVKSSLSTFVSIAFVLAVSTECKSIAFPAVGCGKFNFDPSIIAKYMLHETRKQLTTFKIKMNISFVLLSTQQNVYDEFIKYLNQMLVVDLMVSTNNPTKKQVNKSTIAYDKKIIKITLISSNDNHLMQCKQEIIDLARSLSIKSQLTNKNDMLDWSQNTINKYYEYCIKQNVMPTLDFDNVTIELVGAKDAIHEAEKYFYELTSETFKEARIHAVSRGAIWSIELIPNSDVWEQYSFKLNGIIEDAFLKKYPHVDFQNDQEEKCRIVFSVMQEHHETNIRRVRRKPVDSTLPDTWETSDQSCKRVTLQPSSKEYQNVLAQFHVTMLGKYSNIVKIERIQNERWYKQYAAHRDDFKRRYPQIDYERLLFHGCPSTSVDQIARECFNRSFAGVNGKSTRTEYKENRIFRLGVLYGCGVYFHVQASYSHQYAQPNSAGERTIFLARVLIGKTCKGDKTMKVPPSGYDTTTDGQHIFVVYHDAGAYADHLITYK
ncbi:unnamed protein product [Rotaria sp. Silwood1]|nr:unnamed protein product [Rotaria sp. Silwood1]